MKSFEEFRSQQQEEDLQEVAPAALGIGAGIKWGLGAWGAQKLMDILGWGANTAKDVVANTGKTIVDQGLKTAKKAWDGGDNKINAVKGTDEKGLPKVS